jgi:hypothetical protein
MFRANADARIKYLEDEILKYEDQIKFLESKIREVDKKINKLRRVERLFISTFKGKVQLIFDTTTSGFKHNYQAKLGDVLIDFDDEEVQYTNTLIVVRGLFFFKKEDGKYYLSKKVSNAVGELL